MTELNEDNRLKENLRQEIETFNQNKSQQSRWFNLRIRMGYTALVILLAVVVSSFYIIFNYRLFPEKVVYIAAVALFADIVGLIISIFKIILNPGLTINLAPVTEWHPSSRKGIAKKIEADVSHNEDKLVILNAVYGAEDAHNDVTEILISKIENDSLELHVTNYEMKADPKKGKRKALTVTYVYKGKSYTKVASEGSTLRIP
jgi:hypothetical protein